MKGWLKSLPGRIVEGLIVAAILATVGSTGVLTSHVPVWIAGIALLVVGGGALFLGARVGRKDDLAAYYAEHVREALNTLQKVAAGTLLGVTSRDFIEKGVLAPARYWLMRVPDEDVRMMVIRPKEPDRRVFELVWEVGHSVEARKKFSLEIAGSFAGIAYTSGNTEWSNDVENDPRWHKHPQARPGREYGSLASVPIRRGDEVVAVLNVISTNKKAFWPADLNYIELLASLVSLIMSALKGSEPAAQQVSTRTSASG